VLVKDPSDGASAYRSTPPLVGGKDVPLFECNVQTREASENFTMPR
jgi:hypothetical protein